MMIWKNSQQVFLCFCALFLLPAALQAESLYLTRESHLRMFEKELESWETDRQSLLSRARELKRESENLNALLKRERDITRDLRQSFETSEAVRISRELALKENIDTLTREKEEALREALETRNQRNVLIGVVGLLLLAAGGALFLRIKGIL